MAQKYGGVMLSLTMLSPVLDTLDTTHTESVSCQKQLLLKGTSDHTLQHGIL
jgi:hypothetical protein